ncbi:hypothetical protein RJ639_009279 [Escallonia herrerae]|uniref:Retrovirus-related Pol polyprotein from transposon TNT 1-94-like beta-barrel domain-containing protein n=1 Tax=Escallonia herrerae TaxID=1293975 RepID=A0AA88VTU8_9ASTE|nr:hypothetical protein RJ639_009279 [Escallonia herrerae]
MANARIIEDNSDDVDVLSVTISSSDGGWILDMGYSYHRCPNREWFATYRSFDGGKFLIRNDVACKVVGIGSIQIRMYDGIVRTLTDIRHVPDWKATLQTIVALSTTEAKYTVVTEAVKEAIWLKGLVGDLGLKQEFSTVYCDSQSATHLTKNQMFHERIKHIDVRFHFIQDVVSQGTVMNLMYPLTALVDLYAKCGHINFAYRTFKQMPVRILISWNPMISGFAQNGKSDKALRIFREMVKEGPKPISFLGVLFACCHAGLVDSGRKYFGSMAQDYGIKPGIEHYTCMIDLLGRAEQIDEAEDLICKADFSDDYSLWAALLGVCTTCTNSIVVEGIAMKIMELDPNHYLSYVLLANVYKAVGRWDDAVNIRKLMEGSRVKKKLSGKSWIDINSILNSSLQINYTGLPGPTYHAQSLMSSDSVDQTQPSYPKYTPQTAIKWQTEVLVKKTRKPVAKIIVGYVIKASGVL